MNFMKDYILEKELRAMRRELLVSIVILLLVIGHCIAYRLMQQSGGMPLRSWDVVLLGLARRV